MVRAAKATRMGKRLGVCDISFPPLSLVGLTGSALILAIRGQESNLFWPHCSARFPSREVARTMGSVRHDRTRVPSLVSTTQFPGQSRSVMKNPFLIGEKLYLRPLEQEDAPHIVPWFNDPDVRRTTLRHL